MHDPRFDDRAKSGPMYELYEGESSNSSFGVLFASGPTWKLNRRFSLKTLRDFGFGRKTAETFILEETDYVARYMKEQMQDTGSWLCQDIEEVFLRSALNVVWQMVAGERFDYDHQNMGNLQDIIRKFNTFAQECFVGPFAVFPWLRYL